MTGLILPKIVILNRAKDLAKRSDRPELDSRPNGLRPGGLHYVKNDREGLFILG